MPAAGAPIGWILASTVPQSVLQPCAAPSQSAAPPAPAHTHPCPRRRCPALLQGELSLIEQLLPEELLLHIFERLPITALAAAQGVCRQWRRVGAAQPLWRRACM